jgi:hypothetical protein
MPTLLLRTLGAAVFGAVCALLAACGGGGSSSPPGPAVSLAGLYEGSGASNRASELLVLDSGRYYLVYGLTSASAAPVGGVVVGDGSVGGSVFSSTNAHDFDLVARTVATGSLTATVVPKASASSVVVHAGGATTTYAGSYDPASESNASAAAVPGTYGGEFAGLGGTAAAVLSVDAFGVIAASTTSGCSLVGLALPASRGNVYDLTLTFGAGCASPGSTLHGHAFLKGKALYAVAITGDLATVALFAGVKP